MSMAVALAATCALVAVLVRAGGPQQTLRRTLARGSSGEMVARGPRQPATLLGQDSDLGRPATALSHLGRGISARLDRLLRRGTRPDLALLLRSLAAELAAGQPAGVALVEACRSVPGGPCPRGRAAARLGGDVASGLRADAEADRSRSLRALAACWEVAAQSGAGLAVAVARLAESEAAASLARADLHSELAAVRASARLLAGLPVLGLLLAWSLGAQPVAWLLSTSPGRGALLAGILLQACGMLWLRRIVARAQAGIP